MIESFTQIALCLVGSFTHIVWVMKKESDKFETSRKNFNESLYIKKNKWDFIFYVLAGLVTLTAKELIGNHLGVEGLTDMSLSVFAGLLGSVILEKIMK